MVSGWNVGFQKVEFTKFLRSEFGYSLAEAKAATDAVLDNQEVALRIPDREVRRISARLTELDAKFVLKE